METTGSVRRRCTVSGEPRRGRSVLLYGVDGRTYHAIDATEAVRERLAGLRRGDAVCAVLEPIRCRGDGWRLVRLDEVTHRGESRSRSDADGGVTTAMPSR